MNIFSYVLVVIMAGCFIDGLRYRDKAIIKLFFNFFVLTSIITLVLNYGYFIKIGSYEFEYDEVCCGVLFVFAVLLVFSGKYDRKIINLALIFLLCDVIAIIFMLIFPYVSTGFITYAQSWDGYCYGEMDLTYYFSVTSSTFMIPFRFAIFFVVLSVIKSVFTQTTWNKIIKIFFIVCKIYIVYGIAEYLLKNFMCIDVSEAILTPIFGLGGATYSSLSSRADSYTMQGLFRETSYYAAFLFVAGFCFSLKVKSVDSKKIDSFWFAVAIVLMLISGSFSSVLYVVIDVIVYLICISKKRNGAIVVLISVVVAVLVVLIYCVTNSVKLEYYFERLTNTFDVIQSLISGESISKVTSEGVRFTSIFNLITLWLHYPLFGVGYGTASGHSALFWMLSNGGIAGFVLWYRIVFCKTLNVKNTNIFIILYFTAMIFTLNLMQFYSISNIVFFYLICKTTVKKSNKTAKIEYKKGFNAS